MATRKLTVNIEHIDPRVGDTFGFQVSNNGTSLAFADGVGWDKTFVETTEEEVAVGRIINMNSDLTVDNFYEGFDGDVLDVATQTDGKTIVVGNFSSYNGVSTTRICRLNTDGTLDATFNIGAGANGTVRTVVYNPIDSTIYIGGDFTVCRGVSANRICKINSNGTLNMTFVSNTMSAAANKGFNNSVNALVYANGALFVGGKFTNFNNWLHNRIVRLNSNGTVNNTFNASIGFQKNVDDATTEVHTMLLTDGGTNMFVGGNFNRYIGIEYKNIVKIQLNGTPVQVDNWIAGRGTNGVVYTIKTLTSPNPRVLIGGDFITFNGDYSPGLVYVLPNGQIDPSNLFGDSFDMGGSIKDITNIGDTIYVGGSMIGYNGAVCGNLVSISLITGDIVDSFRVNSTITKLKRYSDDILAVGLFDSYTIVAVNGGSSFLTIPVGEDIIAAFGAGFNGAVNRIFHNPIEDNYIVCGLFTQYKGNTANKLCKVGKDGDFILGLTGTTDDLYNNLVVLSDGSIRYFGEFFNGTDLTSVGFVTKVNNNFTIDTSFNSGELGLDFPYSSKLYELNNGDLFANVDGNPINYNGIAYSFPYNGKYLILDKDSGAVIEYGQQPRNFQYIETPSNGDIIFFQRNSGSLNGVVRTGLVEYSQNFNQAYGRSLSNENLVLLGTYSFFGNNMIEDMYGTFAEDLIVVSSDSLSLVKYNTGSGFNNKYYGGLYVDNNDNIYVVADAGLPFTTYNGTACGMIAKFNSNLTLNSSFNPTFSYSGGNIETMYFDYGYIVLLGSFTTVNGVSANGIVYLDYNGNIITTIPNLYQTIQNTYDNLVEFNSGAGISYSVDGSDVIMEYEFDEEEIVVQSVYDTPDHVEITFFNESLTINDLIEEILVRSPHLIYSEEVDFDTTEFEIKAWDGSLFAADSQPVLYSKTKQKLVPTQDVIYVNINNLVREKLEAKVFDFLDESYEVALPLTEGVSKWVQVKSTTFLEGVELETKLDRLFVLDGYLTPLETQDDIPNILMTGEKRYIHRDQLQRVYFKANKLLSATATKRFSNGFEGIVDLAFDIDIFDNRKYYQSFLVDTTDVKSITYSFVYEDSAIQSVTYEVYDDCGYELFNLVYKNKWGVLESIPMSRAFKKALKTSKEEMLRSIVDINGNYDISRHTNKQFNVNGMETWTLNTNYIPEYMNQAFQEAMLSEEMWVIDSSNIIYPVIKEEDSIDFKTRKVDGLIQYTIKVKLSHTAVKNIQ